MSTESNTEHSDWYGTRGGRVVYWGLIVATVLAVVVSTAGVPGFLNTVVPVPLPDPETAIPPYVYLFGFLGATVYAFTTFARRFDNHGRYRLKVLSRTIAALPLVAGVYLLAFAFLGFGTESTMTDEPASAVARERVIAGLVFLAGLYVSTTLIALEAVANRLLGIDTGAGDQTQNADQEAGQNGTEDRTDSDDGDGSADASRSADAAESGDTAGSDEGTSGDSPDRREA